MTEPKHVPILVDEITRLLLEPFLKWTSSEVPTLLDCTFGGGGHTAALLGAFHAQGVQAKVLAIDQDPAAVENGRRRFAQEIVAGRIEIEKARITELAPLLSGRKVLGVLADLGISSDQLDDPSRGLSFRTEGPIDFRLDPSRAMSGADWLKQWTESELEEVLRVYGEERFSRRIARSFVQRRQKGEWPAHTRELADWITRAMPGMTRGTQKIHPATRSFQALRIAVNDELGELDSLLERVILTLEPGGRMAILSFHSLEDRKVKQRFAALVARGSHERVTRKPIVPSEEETRMNPRARSAKLRVIERVKE